LLSPRDIEIEREGISKSLENPQKLAFSSRPRELVLALLPVSRGRGVESRGEVVLEFSSQQKSAGF